MKWYRRMYFKIFEWYRGMNGLESWPDTYAAGILGSLHGMNVLAIALFVGLPVSNPSLPYGMTGWVLAGMLISVAPPLWCSLHSKEIEREFETEEEIVNPSGRIWVAVYAVATVLAVISAGVRAVVR